MLNELQNAFGLLDYRKEVIINGHLITISAKEGIGYGKQLSSTNNNFLYTLKVYEDAVPNTLYIEIDSLGNFLRVLRETEGTMPELFISPDDSIWSVNTCLDDRKDVEVVLPLDYRSEINKVNKYRSFVGEWIGNFKDSVFFYKKELFGKKADQLCRLEIVNKVILKGEIIKIPQPNMNKVYFEHQDNFQLLAWHEDKLLHRKINQKGQISDERILELCEIDDVEILRLSFENNTFLIGFNNNSLIVVSFTPNGDVIRKKLIELEPKSIFYSISTPKKINSKNYLISFVGENFNGWAVINLNQVLECYICFKDGNSYKDILSDKVIFLPESDVNHFVISGVSVNNRETYQVAIYNSKQGEKPDNQLFIILRQY